MELKLSVLFVWGEGEEEVLLSRGEMRERRSTEGGRRGSERSDDW